MSARSPAKVSHLEQGRLTALDGIRAFAVLAVIAFHAGVPGVEGGLLGVDVFFVLSGYLITSILRREFAADTPSPSAPLMRRARRLLPALFILLLGVAAYAHFYAATLNLASIRADAASTLLYLANWHFILSSQGYFAQSAAPSPLLHTWSLGVEEQYYLIWPLAAVFVMRRFGPRGLAWTAGLGALASATVMGVLFAEGFSIDRLYYGTDTRAQALLVGSFLGAVGVAGSGRYSPNAGAASVPPGGGPGGRSASSARHTWCGPVTSSGARRPSCTRGLPAVALATGAVIVAVVTWPGSVLARVLSVSALTYIGRISYGLYLYHWPLFLVVDHHHTGLSGASLLAVRLALTFAVATASFFLVEEPIRTGRLVRHWRAAASTAVAVAITAGAVVAATVTPVGAVPHTVARAIPPAERDQLVAARAFAADPVRFAMFGDSISDTLGVGLRDQSKQHYGIREFLDSKIGCDLDPNLKVFMGGIVGPAVPGCPDWRRTWKQDIDAARPEVAGLLVGRWEVADHYYDGHWTHVGQPLWDDHLLNELNTAVDILSSDGAKVIVFTTPFVNPSNEEPNGTPFSENQPSRVLAYNKLVRQLAAQRPGLVTVIDLNKLVDPQGHFHDRRRRARRPLDRRHPHHAGRRRVAPAVHPADHRPPGPRCRGGRSRRSKRTSRRRPARTSAQFPARSAGVALVPPLRQGGPGAAGRGPRWPRTGGPGRGPRAGGARGPTGSAAPAGRARRRPSRRRSPVLVVRPGHPGDPETDVGPEHPPGALGHGLGRRPAHHRAPGTPSTGASPPVVGDDRSPEPGAGAGDVHQPGGDRARRSRTRPGPGSGPRRLGGRPPPAPSSGRRARRRCRRALGQDGAAPPLLGVEQGPTASLGAGPGREAHLDALDAAGQEGDGHVRSSPTVGTVARRRGRRCGPRGPRPAPTRWSPTCAGPGSRSPPPRRLGQPAPEVGQDGPLEHLGHLVGHPGTA